jgi:hypothetical protein
LKRWLDRVLTGDVLCRNCPAWLEHGAGVGVCGRDPAVLLWSEPGKPAIEAFPVKRSRDWCVHHPLYDARKAEGLYYAPGAAGAADNAGFNRPPSMAEALRLAQSARATPYACDACTSPLSCTNEGRCARNDRALTGADRV